ncbi:NAD(P)-dependent oxidoreductase [Pusillimonas noertemannii]|uniref:NAD(P)-dependent oxidoreductase n=1 Tax=Pusillimonas noertemannii TaxID=305977 RepID=UPI0033421E64
MNAFDEASGSKAALVRISRVGVVGAGRMGLPIIGHLVRHGFQVDVHDTDEAKREAVLQAGARWQPEAGALARDSEAMLVCVGYDDELRRLAAPGGLFSSMKPGAVLALLSTVKPDTVQLLARQAGLAGIHVLDAPVCRGGRAADTGTLLTFAGGDATALERLRPVLSAYSSDIVHTGQAGSAQIAKAANNMVLWACLVADHEAFALAHSYGLDVESLRQALMTSSAANDVLRHWGTNEMVWADDDLAIVADLARDCGIALPQSDVVREVCRELRPRRYQLEAYGR